MCNKIGAGLLIAYGKFLHINSDQIATANDYVVMNCQDASVVWRAERNVVGDAIPFFVAIFRCTVLRLCQGGLPNKANAK